MYSLFFKFFFSEFFSPSSIIQYTCTKNICTKKITLVSNQNLLIYIFLTVVPTESNKVFHFFILKKKNKPKQLKHQLIS